MMRGSPRPVNVGRLMVIFAVIFTLLIVCLELLHSERKSVVEGQVLRFSRCETYPGNPLTSLYSLSLLKGHKIGHYISLRDEMHEGCLIFNYTRDSPAKHLFTFCNISILDDICWNVTPIWQAEFMDPISRLPFPGGMGSFDIFHVLLSTSHHLSLRLFAKTKPGSSLYVDINFDADYETVVGKSEIEFKQFTLLHLQALFRRNYLRVHALSIQRGSIRISFILSHETVPHTEHINNGPTSSLPVPNHIKTAMRRKLLHLSLNPIMRDYSKGIDYTLGYFESQMNAKYPKLLNYATRHLSLRVEKLPYSELRRIAANYKTLRSFPRKIRPFWNDQNTPVDATHQRKSLKDKLFLGTRTAEAIRTRRSVQTNTENSSLLVKVRFILETPAVTEQVNEELYRHLQYQLAKRMRVPLPCIKSMVIKSGTDVSFTLSTFNDGNNAMDDQSVFEAADFLKKEIKENKLRLTDLNGRILMTASSAYVSTMDDNSVDFSLVVLIILCVTLIMIIALIFVLVYIARRISRMPETATDTRKKAYRNLEFGRDSSQSVGKYSYDSGLWIGPGAEPTFEVPEAPYYRPPTVEQITSTPRPVTAVRTRLKRNWNVDERALSTIPDDLGRPYLQRENNYH